MNIPSIIGDARTVKEPESRIAQGIVSGVLEYTGLPKIGNIVHGVGSPMRKGGPTKVLEVPKEEQSATKMVSGTAGYAGTQDKKKKSKKMA
jgi:hypothetical protein